MLQAENTSGVRWGMRQRTPNKAEKTKQNNTNNTTMDSEQDMITLE